jgi:L-ascorbate metabolism protein UlaG (beta-lactamase superfamily)
VQHGAGAPPFPRHFDGKRFFNPDAPQARGFFEALRWKVTSRPERSARFVSDVVPSKPPASVEGNELRVTMINHSTLLIQQSGGNILTDPVWSERVSPFQSIGLVLLSHNHYDHLDLATLRRLADRGQSQFIVPCGVAQWLKSKGIGPAHELDWGDSLRVANTIVHSVPAMHFSARGLFDRNRTLWCGYVIEAADRVIYFAGDTGFGEHFAQIRERFGAPRLAFLPIGAYEPRWFMAPVHMAPDEAIRAHEILAAKTSIAIHHGTFQLAD